MCQVNLNSVFPSLLELHQAEVGVAPEAPPLAITLSSLGPDILLSVKTVAGSLVEVNQALIAWALVNFLWKVEIAQNNNSLAMML